MGYLTKIDYEMKINIQNQFFKFIIRFSRRTNLTLSDDLMLPRFKELKKFEEYSRRKKIRTSLKRSSIKIERA